MTLQYVMNVRVIPNLIMILMIFNFVAIDTYLYLYSSPYISVISLHCPL